MSENGKIAKDANRSGLEPVSAALRRLAPLDAEIIRLRHDCELTNTETAAQLEVVPAVASRLYVRALRRLGEKITVDASVFVPFNTEDATGQSMLATR